MVGLTSRWDYGSDGSRVGLLLKMKEVFEKRGVDFLVLAGGIVSKRACLNVARRIRDEEKKVYDKLKAEMDKLAGELLTFRNKLLRLKKHGNKYNSLLGSIAAKQRQIGELRFEMRAIKPRTIGQILFAMIEEIAKQINQDLPRLVRPDGERMKIYIVTSRAYDGDIGHEVVKRLLELRRDENDVRYLSSRHTENTTHKIPLKKSGRTFAVVVPTKAVWRSAYYSTNADRLLEDEMKRTTKPICDVYAVGCGASAIHRCQGEMPYQRITVPALHKLEDPRTSENMVGVSVVSFVPGAFNCPVDTVSFKDMVSNESQFIVSPPDISDIQKRIIEEINGVNGSEPSIGILQDNLGVSRNKLEKALQALLKLDPKIIDYDEASQKYFLSQEFLKRKIEYSWPAETLVKDVIAGFACMHAGSIHTAYNFIVNEMPKILFENEVTHLLDVGDSIQGLKHDLQQKGEIVSGMNYTVQEKVAGIMIATVLLKVLYMRLERVLLPCTSADKSRMSPEKVMEMVRYNLPDFLFWIGNHDEWPAADGHSPLTIMEKTIWDNLYRGISNILEKFGLPRASLSEIVDSKIHRIKNKTYYTMPSGLVIGGRHYYAGRTSTSSTWCQRGLRHMKEAQLYWIANFHVAESVLEWSSERGLRVAMQVPTLMSMSEFEDTKGKTTDFGLGLVEVWSANRRIISSRVNYLGLNPHSSFDNGELIRLFLGSLGVDNWVDLKRTIK